MPLKDYTMLHPKTQVIGYVCGKRGNRAEDYEFDISEASISE